MLSLGYKTDEYCLLLENGTPIKLEESTIYDRIFILVETTAVSEKVVILCDKIKNEERQYKFEENKALKDYLDEHWLVG